MLVSGKLASWSMVFPERVQYLPLFGTKAVTKQLQFAMQCHFQLVVDTKLQWFLIITPSPVAPVLLDSSTCSSLDIAQLACYLCKSGPSLLCAHQCRIA